MAVKVAINGFGRIGRNIVRALIESRRTDVDIVAINDLGAPEINAHLLRYDSVHGAITNHVAFTHDAITIDEKSIRVTAIRDPAELPWGDVDVALECTGIFASKEKASALLDAGAKRVLVSAPASNADLTVVFGVNHHQINPDHLVISNASCTTNCLAPVAKILNDAIGLTKGFMTTVHAYTGDQNVLDGLHADPRRGRACGLSMIPTSTGAARAVGLVLPELAGKLDGTAVRVPTPNVSMIDLTFIAARSTDVAEVNGTIQAAAGGVLRGVLGVSTEPLVSIDFNHNANSSTFDLTQTQVVDGNLVRVLSWYDNEWGFSNRMLDTSVAIGATL